MKIMLPVAAAVVVLAGGAVVRTSVPDFIIAPLESLPEGPRPRLAPNCEGLITEPTSAAGREIAAHGWGVVSEATVGRFQLVSFAGQFVPGASGSCTIRQGNLGIFEGSDLKAVLHTASKSDEMIGQLRPKEGGEIRLWNGAYPSQPVADILASGVAVSVGEVSAIEVVCGGRASVPNVYGAPVTKAREALMASGWNPVPQPEGGLREMDLARIGITETIGCSGTGLAFCRYEYVGKDASLLLTTTGELLAGNVPAVAYYEVTCLGR